MPNRAGRTLFVRLAGSSFLEHHGYEASMSTILIIILVLLLIGALPTWGHSRSWGYFPSGGLGLLLLILLILLLTGRI